MQSIPAGSRQSDGFVNCAVNVCICVHACMCASVGIYDLWMDGWYHVNH